MLKDKIIVITGGFGRIGRQFVKAIIENNGIPIITDIHDDKSIREELEVEYKTTRFEYYNLDITSVDSINKVILNIQNKYNKIDALINNAYPRNQQYGRPFFEVKYVDFCENVSHHVGGYFLTAQQFAQSFIGQGYGNIINISSVYGVIPPRFDIYENTSMTMPVEYAAIKSAIINLTKYMAKYFRGNNIRVNTLSPGGILADQPPEFLEQYRRYCLDKGMLDAKDLVGTLVYLLSDMSQYVNGQNIVVDDGFVL